MEDVTEVEKAALLVGRARVQRAAVLGRVVRDDPDWMPVDASERDDQRLAVVGRDLEELAAVDAVGHERLHRVGTLAVVRHDRAERLLPTTGRRRGRPDGRQFPYVRGQIAEQFADLLEGLVLAGGGVVDAAGVADMHVGPAELLLGQNVPQRAFDDRRARSEELRRAFNHHVEVREQRDPRGTAGDRAKHGADQRSLLHDLHRPLEDRVVGREVAVAPLGDALDVRAGPVEQIDEGQLELEREVLQQPALAPGLGRRAAADREVGTRDDDPAAVDPAESAHGRRGREVNEFLVGVFARARQAGESRRSCPDRAGR